MNNTPAFSEPVSADDPSDVDYGTLTGTPAVARVLNSGHVMILDGERKSVWGGLAGTALVSSMGLAREVLAHHGYRIALDAPDGFYAVQPVLGGISTPGLTLGPPVALSVDEHPSTYDRFAGIVYPPANAPPVWLGMPLNAAPTPDPLPPGARVFVPLVAQALPCAERGDQIDTNRTHLGWAVWQWLLANKDALAPFFASPPAPPVAQPMPAVPVPEPLAEKAPHPAAAGASPQRWASKRAAATKAPPPKAPAKKAPPAKGKPVARKGR